MKKKLLYFFFFPYPLFSWKITVSAFQVSFLLYCHGHLWFVPFCLCSHPVSESHFLCIDILACGKVILKIFFLKTEQQGHTLEQ